MESFVRRVGLIVLAALSMAHVGSPDTFFAGKAGPYDVRVSVRLPGVIPGRAQVAVHVGDAKAPAAYRVTLQAGQWNVGLKGAPPPENAVAVPGDPSLYAAELWFMTATAYQLSVNVEGPAGSGHVLVPVMAIATAQRTMTPGLGLILAALGVFLTLGLLTIVGAALRESELAPGTEPDATTRRRARVGVAIAAVLVVLMLWGGSRWWTAEATSYGRSILYRPFTSEASIASLSPDRRALTLSIRDPRWTGRPTVGSRYNALLPDHGKLMHLFLVQEPSLDAFAHLHPIARTPEALDFEADVPALPAGRYRVYGDIVHESGYAQTLVTTVDVPASAQESSRTTDPDDSWFAGRAVAGAASASFDLGDGALVWSRGDPTPAAGSETVLNFSVRDASGATAMVEPYMGMAAHAIVASRDGSVFAHLHPSGSVSMAALQKLAAGAAPDAAIADGDPHAGHMMQVSSAVSIPYAFPKAGDYRVWVQVKQDGRVRTAAFDTTVR